MTYPLAFRRHVLQVRERDGLTIDQTAVRFSVGRASVVRWLKEVEPKTRRRPSLKIDVVALGRELRENPDAYLKERAERFGVSPSGMWRALRRVGVQRKKTLRHPKADEAARDAFRQRLEAHRSAGKTIVYIDECGFEQEMPRPYGYAPKGERCVALHPWRSPGKRTNVIGALIGSKLTAVSLYQHTVNGEVFEKWLRETLAPCLERGAILVMDNAPFHKSPKVRQAIKDIGAQLELLPSYSPDLNPIEHKWAQAKAARRKTNGSIKGIFKQIE